MKNNYIAILMAALCLMGTGAYAQANRLTKNEKNEGWELLFNGTDLSNWHIYNRGKVESGWSASEGQIVFRPSGNLIGGVDLVTDEIYGDFDLKLEWKISEGGNSGVFFCVREGEQYPYESYTGIEMQLLDNRAAADRHDPKHLAGALYDLIDVSKTSKPKKAGEWNKSRILFRKGQICFWLNGIKTVSINKDSEQWKTLVAGSKFKDSDFARFNTGHIVFQDHTNEVAFRNIKIKRLN